MFFIQYILHFLYSYVYSLQYALYINYVHGKKFGNIKQPTTPYPRK